MKKSLIWGTGTVFLDTISAIKYHSMIENFEIKSVTSKETNIYKHILDYECIAKKNININEYDFVIIAAEDKIYNEIASEALNLGFKEEQLIMAKVFKHPLFDINKYLDILKFKQTIFSNNCWGVLTYKSLGLKYNSPLVSMWVGDRDYIKFLKNPKKYINTEIEFYDWSIEPTTQDNYPRAKCGDILLNFNHDENFDTAKQKWDKRKKRINWDNLVVMMYTLDKEIEKEFNNLPYDKKFCFVPYETKCKSSVHIDIKPAEVEAFWQVVNRLTYLYIYYNPFDLLLTGTVKNYTK